MIYCLIIKHKTLKNILFIHEMGKSDLPKVKSVVDDNQMFSSEFLDEMTIGYFKQETQDMWFVVEHDEADVNAVAFCSPERMTESTWNLLLIAALKQFQGLGIGTELMVFAESKLRDIAVRV